MIINDKDKIFDYLESIDYFDGYEIKNFFTQGVNGEITFSNSKEKVIVKCNEITNFNFEMKINHSDNIIVRDNIVFFEMSDVYNDKDGYAVGLENNLDLEFNIICKDIELSIEESD